MTRVRRRKPQIERRPGKAASFAYAGLIALFLVAVYAGERGLPADMGSDPTPLFVLLLVVCGLLGLAIAPLRAGLLALVSLPVAAAMSVVSRLDPGYGAAEWPGGTAAWLGLGLVVAVSVGVTACLAATTRLTFAALRSRSDPGI